MKYVIDVDELADWVDDLKSFDDKCQQILDEVDALVAKLHLHWEGLAAAAQQENHQRWVTDLATMREAVVQIRKCAARAHSNYNTIVATNQRMWNH